MPNMPTSMGRGWKRQCVKEDERSGKEEKGKQMERRENVIEKGKEKENNKVSYFIHDKVSPR